MNIGFALASPVTRCPSCGSTNLRASRWNRNDNALLTLVLYPYRCISCEKRFYQWSGTFVALLRAAVVFVFLVAIIMAVIYAMSRDGKAPQTERLPALALSSGGGNPHIAPRAVAADAKMQFDLGIRYLSGDGAPRDRAEALKWLEMAAGGGHVAAQYDLGVMYQTGFGAQRDDALALQWFEQAARQNHAEAQYQMALIYKEGKVVAHDLAKSYAWAYIAMTQGHIGAVTLRDNLLQVMTPQQLEDGRRTANEWRPGTEKPAAAPMAIDAAARR